MSLNLTVHEHVSVLARIFFQCSAAMQESFSFLCPSCQSHTHCLATSGCPFFLDTLVLILPFRWLITALNWQPRIKPWGFIRGKIYSSSSTKLKWTGNYLCLLSNAVHKIGLKLYPSPVPECVTQGLGEAILFNQDWETLSERSNGLFFE